MVIKERLWLNLQTCKVPHIDRMYLKCWGNQIGSFIKLQRMEDALESFRGFCKYDSSDDLVLRYFLTCHWKPFLCRLRSMATHRDHFVCRPSVCLSVFHTFLSHFPELCFAGDTCIPWNAATLFCLALAFTIFSSKRFNITCTIDMVLCVYLTHCKFYVPSSKIILLYTVYRVILARWKFWLYWRMTKIRQIKKRQFFQLQNLKMSEIELHYCVMPSYFYLPINTLNSRYQVINTLDDQVNWP